MADQEWVDPAPYMQVYASETFPPGSRRAEGGNGGAYLPRTEVEYLVELARARVGDNFKIIAHGKVGEPSNGALLLRLAAALDSRTVGSEFESPAR